jgi:hypothetical protein
MNQFFTFEPSEFVVLEDSVEVEETVPRAESVRFYTVEEQTSDAFEKLLPKDKRVSGYERTQLQGVVDKFRDLYDGFVVSTAEDYFLREPSRGTSFDWIRPVVPGSAEYASPFNYVDLIEPSPNAPNYYPRMIAKLPVPFRGYFRSGEGGTTFDKPTEVQDDSDTRVFRILPTFFASRTVLHENGSVSLAMQPYPATEQRVSVVGYALRERTLPIPNPLEGHPFFSDTKARVIRTTEPLANVVPSVDAVLMHGVPVTTDPYGEAAPFLKLYDVSLSSIPWSSWKMRFPPVPSEEVLAVREDMKFPDARQQAPGGKLLEVYRSTYNPGVSPREWLLRRDDGGEWVVKALLSTAIENGSVAVLPGIDLPLPAYDPVRPEDCGLDNLSFVEFANRGILRRTWETKKGRSREEDVDTVRLTCAPIEFVIQERARAGHTGRISWKEGTTDDEIKRGHLEALLRYRFLADAERPVEYPRVEPKSTSQKHIDVLTVLNDPYRLVEDKIRDINALLRNAILSNNVYSDSEGRFVLCKHTLAILAGDAAADAAAYYDTWGVAEAGSYICKFCGQAIDAVEFDSQVEFDGYDKAVVHAEALDSSPSVSFSSVKEEVTALSRIRPMFQSKNAGHMIMFLLLSLLQVLPSSETLDMFLKALSKITGTKMEGLASKDQIIRCKAGVAMTAVLLQAHVPILVPRRSFGSKPLVLSGYPRDTPEVPTESQYSIVDSLLLVLRNTFEAFPTAIDPLYRDFIREVLGRSKSTRSKILEIISGAILPKVDGMKKLLSDAAVYIRAIPPSTEVKALIPVVMPPPKLGVNRSYEACPSARPILPGLRKPLLRQEEVPLGTGIRATSKRTPVQPSLSVRAVARTVSDAEIRGLLRGGEPKLPFVVSDNYRTNLLLASNLAMLAGIPDPTRTIDTTQPTATLRDLSKGIIYDIFRKIENPSVLKSLKSDDLATYCVSADVKKEEREVTSIRARERLAYVKRMGSLTDTQRELYLDLAKRGMAPILITTSDRVEFAKQVEEGEAQRAEEEYNELHGEVGVGAPPGLAVDDEEDMPALEPDYEAMGQRFNDGHDVLAGASFQDSALGPI